MYRSVRFMGKPVDAMLSECFEGPTNTSIEGEPHGVPQSLRSAVFRLGHLRVKGRGTYYELGNVGRGET